MRSLFGLSRIFTTPVTEEPARPSRRERRAERELLAQLSTRPQNVRDELLEMIYRAH